MLHRGKDALDQDRQRARFALVQANHLLLHQALELALREDAVEVLQRRAQQPLSRRSSLAERPPWSCRESCAADHLERGDIEVLLALEVVVEQRLVHAGRFGNLVGAGAGQAMGAEFAESGVEDAARASSARSA